MLAAVCSASLLGVTGQPVRVEVHVSSGLPAYTLVGLPDAAGRESRERVRAAMLSSRLPFPMQRITVNLAPSGIRKCGAAFELAVALGLLLAGDELPAGALERVGVVGELGLDGSVRPVTGVLALVDALRRDGCQEIIVPASAAAEAALVDGITVRPARTLRELHESLVGQLPWPDYEIEPGPVDGDVLYDEPLDLADVRGLPVARQALEICAAGGHHLLLAGPPGAGKTMLARRLPSILDGLDADDALEVTRIHSVAGTAPSGRLITTRPFRAPHHSASIAAMVGGGSGRTTPGEVTLAHRGVLFLDELGEFAPRALEALRQPLEERVVRIARQGTSVEFPADFVLIACTNPCPCGREPRLCTCTPAARERYRRRLSAPLLDRFDLRLRVCAPAATTTEGEESGAVAARVRVARARQRRRLRSTPWRANAQIPAGALKALVPLDRDAEEAWRRVSGEQLATGRGAAKLRRIARTLADLADREHIEPGDLILAASLRQDVP